MSTLVLPWTTTAASDTRAHGASQQGEAPNAALVDAQSDRASSPRWDRAAVEPLGAISLDHAQRSEQYTAPDRS
jgi:hypothetical protein